MHGPVARLNLICASACARLSVDPSEGRVLLPQHPEAAVGGIGRKKRRALCCGERETAWGASALWERLCASSFLHKLPLDLAPCFHLPIGLKALWGADMGIMRATGLSAQRMQRGCLDVRQAARALERSGKLHPRPRGRAESRSQYVSGGKVRPACFLM